ncbi:MAG: rplJ [Candidatus Levybacteria bacterium]|nr:rplJ [Candidatus Levybacteria bacterium]
MTLFERFFIINMENTDKKPTSHIRTSASRAKKEKIVAELLEKVNRAKGFVFTSYQGLTHKQLEVLKKAVQAFDADFVATKNTLIEIAMLNSKHEIRNSKQIQNSNDENSKRPSVSDFGFRISDLQDATATLFLYGDPVMPLKAIAKSIKELNLPTIKFGILDGAQMTSEDLLKLSTLPSRETLLAQLVFGLKSPISGLHRALNWNIQKFVMTLKAIGSKKMPA